MILLLFLTMLLVAGLWLLISGKLPLSKRNEVVGKPARVIGLLLVLLPFLGAAVAIAFTKVMLQLDSSEPSAQVWGSVAGYVSVSLGLIVIALNLKRWSTPIRLETIAATTNQFAGLAEQDRGSTDFAFLGGESADPQAGSTASAPNNEPNTR